LAKEIEGIFCEREQKDAAAWGSSEAYSTRGEVFTSNSFNISGMIGDTERVLGL
jgi:hypothetical protein